MNEWLTVAFSALSLFGSGLLVYRLETSRRNEESFKRELKEEFQHLHAKDERLGMHIQQNRGALDFVCGKLGLDRPQYPPE